MKKCNENSNVLIVDAGIYSFSLPAGLDLGSEADMENRLQICKSDVLSALQEVSSNTIVTAHRGDKTCAVSACKITLWLPLSASPCVAPAQSSKAISGTKTSPEPL